MTTANESINEVNHGLFIINPLLHISFVEDYFSVNFSHPNPHYLSCGPFIGLELPTTQHKFPQRTSLVPQAPAGLGRKWRCRSFTNPRRKPQIIPGSLERITVRDQLDKLS
ncbi:hypothetical protein H2248_000461 [Termitomyces sp. 'cryptogamus']|nr:hypothetical protein H2248_000461 [Termitomyces sp. 'cryptogamus']